MIKNPHKVRRTRVFRNSDERKEAKLYLKGLVYSWCKQHAKDPVPTQWFAARDLLGGENFYWQKTPMIPIYEYYARKGSKNPVGDAGRAAGNLLMEVLHEDAKREFETRVNYVRQYRWTGVEMN